MARPTPKVMPREPAGVPLAGLPVASVGALRQLEKVQGGMGVLTVALEHAAAPEFSNEGAALILRMLRQEAARGLAALAPHIAR